jgi:hypothetical protein
MTKLRERLSVLMLNDGVAMSDAWGKLYDDLKAIDRENNERVLAGDGMESKRKAAVATLEHHGFTWRGGEQWKPPLGLPPAFVSNDRAELQEYRKAAGEPVAWMVIDSGSGEKFIRTDRSNIEGAAMPLYANPQPAPAVGAVPVVPDEIEPDDGNTFDYVDGWNACRAAMLKSLHTIKAAPALSSLSKTGEVLHANYPVIPDGWVLAPVEPTEDMVIAGFESEPDETFSKPEVWEEYQAMTGCQQAAYRAKLCWSAMLAAAPQQEVK